MGRRHQAESRPGRIVCTDSTSGLPGNLGQANYGAAKAGFAAFAQIVAQEMARYGVICNEIATSGMTPGLSVGGQYRRECSHELPACSATPSQMKCQHDQQFRRYGRAAGTVRLRSDPARPESAILPVALRELGGGRGPCQDRLQRRGTRPTG